MLTDQVQIACIEAAKEITLALTKNLVVAAKEDYPNERNLQLTKQVYQEVYATIANAINES
ncbi:hypothetical protein [Paenibacillus oryzisoli]|uniref:Uncharacterized protein n=1 Tax=Paenibacillus oryzisoli TaxID=1850517 RepID=A0A198ADI0_9BACL|nr:hypothetical protein [Paenibacillus oryzisoli]OAS19242.1 hypothetical protein A8708_26385 [Paenibacillus oryzisoli]